MDKEFRRNIFKSEQILICDEFSSSIYPFLEKIDIRFKESKIVKNDKYISAGIFALRDNKIFVKKYIKRGPLYRVGHIFKKTRIENNLAVYNFLKNHSLDKLCPKILALVVRYKLCLFSDSYLITEYLENMFTQEFFDTLLNDREKSLKFYNEIIKTICCLHNNGVFHSDAKLWNFFQIPNQKFEFGMFDYDGAVIYKKIPLEKRTRDLARLISSIIELNYVRKINLYNDDFIDSLLLKYLECSGVKISLLQIHKKIVKYLLKKGIAP